MFRVRWREAQCLFGDFKRERRAHAYKYLQMAQTILLESDTIRSRNHIFRLSGVVGETGRELIQGIVEGDYESIHDNDDQDAAEEMKHDLLLWALFWKQIPAKPY